MDQKQNNEEYNQSFLKYYLPSLSLFLITITLAISLVLFPSKSSPILFLIIIMFSLYRWFVSRWMPNILNTKALFQNKKQDYEHSEMIRRAEGGGVTATTGPGIIDKLYYWVMNKFLSIIFLCVIWLPMEFFIQLKFLIKAKTAWKDGGLLTSRRGLWPGEESKLQEA